MLKVVIDTNQFVSSVIAKHGPSSKLLQAWQENLYILIASREILIEIKRTLNYPRIAQKYCIKKEDIEFLINLIEHEAVVIPISIKLDVIKADPDDNNILACAVEAKADYIVSGDKHLLNLHQYEGVAIVAVNEFWEISYKLP